MKKLNFDLLIPPQGRGGGGGGGWGGWHQAKYLLPCCCIPESLQFDMQHDHVLKKFKFDLLTLSPGSGVGVCEQNICYHVAAFLIPFSLICNMSML